MSFSRNLPSQSLEEIMNSILVDDSAGDDLPVVSEVAMLPEASGSVDEISIAVFPSDSPES